MAAVGMNVSVSMPVAVVNSAVRSAGCDAAGSGSAVAACAPAAMPRHCCAEGG